MQGVEKVLTEVREAVVVCREFIGRLHGGERPSPVEASNCYDKLSTALAAFPAEMPGAIGGVLGDADRLCNLPATDQGVAELKHTLSVSVAALAKLEVVLPDNIMTNIDFPVPDTDDGIREALADADKQGKAYLDPPEKIGAYHDTIESGGETWVKLTPDLKVALAKLEGPS